MGRSARDTFRACKGLKSASKVLLTPIANRCIKWGMPIERAMQYAHGCHAKFSACVSGESLYKGLTETLIKRNGKMFKDHLKELLEKQSQKEENAKG